MQDNPVEKAVEVLVDVSICALPSNLKKRVLCETVKSYGKAFALGTTALPLALALNSSPTIAQEREKEPEFTKPHVPSQTQNVNLREISTIVVTGASTASNYKSFVAYRK